MLFRSIVALFPNFMPKCRPRISATMQHSAVVKPIRVAADAMLSESAAKLTPTASASMLVAIAWKNKTGIVSFAYLSKTSSGSSWNASQSILPPMNPRITNVMMPA